MAYAIVGQCPKPLHEHIEQILLSKVLPFTDSDGINNEHKHCRGTA